MPLIIGAKSASAATGVANSCRFNKADSAYLTKTSGTATNVDICTLSAWIKRSTLTSNDEIIMGEYTDGSNRGKLLFNADQLHYHEVTGGGTTASLKITRVLRDPAAWYHIIVAFDTTQGTDTDRIKFYINGVQETDFETTTYPSQNGNVRINESSVPQFIGQAGTTGTYFDGYMAEVCFIDGQQLTPSSFGEFDEDSPTIWKPIDVSGLTFGNNGFYFNFEDSADLGADVSGNSNDFTATNIDATDQATDTPANNFATGNPLSNPRVVSSTVYLPTYSNGNNTINHANASYYTGDRSSIGVMSGKWYVEAECSAVGDELFIGLTSEENHSEIDTTYLYEDDGTFGGSAYGSAYVSGDIIQIAFDATNGTVWFGLNGTWQNSATAEEIQNGTTTNAAASGLTMTKFWHIASKGYNGATWNFNFGGCPAFTVSSGNADGDGYGNFEYAPPSGYYALCTKNLAEYG